jgi:hypothetical protein
MKLLCRDCRWASFPRVRYAWKWKCERLALACINARKQGSTPCGPEGVLWESAMFEVAVARIGESVRTQFEGPDCCNRAFACFREMVDLAREVDPSITEVSITSAAGDPGWHFPQRWGPSEALQSPRKDMG